MLMLIMLRRCLLPLPWRQHISTCFRRLRVIFFIVVLGAIFRYWLLPYFHQMPPVWKHYTLIFLYSLVIVFIILCHLVFCCLPFIEEVGSYDLLEMAVDDYLPTLLEEKLQDVAPTVLFDKTKVVEEGLKYNTECAICLTGIEDGETCRVFRCNHIFHKRCIDSWLRKKLNCPICRFHVI